VKDKRDYSNSFNRKQSFELFGELR
jgi:hypothetical protein